MTLIDLSRRLVSKFGSRSDPDTWWQIHYGRTEPATFERALTNILVTQTDWECVPPALNALDTAGLLTAAALAVAQEAVIAECVKPVGLQTRKAQVLRTLATFVISRFRTEAEFCAKVTREELLNLRGVGEETADRILLYTCGRLEWPVDTYCRRVLTHYDIIQPLTKKPTAREKREQTVAIKSLVSGQMPAELEVWQRLHALMQLEGESLRLAN